jgi:hypothetical protein
MRSATCANVDPELFFPANSRQPATEAKQICTGCPVQAECLQYSLVNEGLPSAGLHASELRGLS